MKPVKTIINRLHVAMTDARQNESHFESWMILNEAICDAIDALTEQPAQQRHISYVCPQCYWSLEEQPAPVAEPHEQHDCSRSHPHENMDAMCELRTEIARLTNENARLKAKQQSDEVNAYRMTLLCIRDGLQQGMSKSIQKLQAREINDVLGMPSFASYRTSPSASPSQGDIKPWVGLTDEERDEIYNTHEPYADLKAIEAKLREKNEPREKNA